MSYLSTILFLIASIFAVQEPASAPVDIDEGGAAAPTRELVVQAGSGGVAFHSRPDGSLIATGGSAGVQLWNSRGRLLRTITHLGRVSYMDLNPKHDLMVVGDWILDLHGNQVVELMATTVHEGKNYTSPPRGQGHTWSPDGEVLAVETTAGFFLFNRSGEMLVEVSGHLDALCFSASSKEVYGATTEHYSNEPIVHVWNLQGEKLLSFPAGEARGLRYLVASQDGKHIGVSLTRHPQINIGDGPLVRIFTTDGTWVRDLKTGTSSCGLLAFGESEFLTLKDNDTQRWSADGELLGELKGFSVSSCTDEMLIGTLLGPTSTLRKGLWGYRFVDKEGHLLHQLPGEDFGIDAVAVSPTADILACLDRNGLVRVLKFTGELVNTFQPMDSEGNALLAAWSRRPMAFTKDGKSLIVYVIEKDPKREFIHRYALSGQLLERQTLPYGERSVPAYTAKWMGAGKTLPGIYAIPHPDGSHAVEYARSPTIRLLRDPSSKRRNWGSGYHGYKPAAAWSPDGRRLYLLGSGRLSIRDARTGDETSMVRTEIQATDLAISPDGKYMAYIGANERDGTVTLLDADGNKLKELAHPGVESLSGMRGPFFTHDGRGIVTAGKDGSLRIWLWEQDQAVNLLFRGEQWIIYTDEGLFDGSRGGGQMLGMTLGMDSFSVDQFALRFNRPDQILELLGTHGVGETQAATAEDSEGERGLTVVAKKAARRTRTLVEHYRAQYLRRLRKAGLTEEDLTAPLHAPELNAELLRVENGIAHVSVDAVDTLYPLGQLFYWINGVPGGDHPLNKKTFKGEIEVILGAGENRIEVSALNSRGTESLRVLVDVMHDVTVNPALHVIALGVSDYRDDDLDLAFAHQDAQDLASQLAKNGSGKYSEVVVHLLVNEQVTQESIQALFDPLSKVGVNDTVVMFVAGHGVHDSDTEATWYYLTHEADLDNLAESTVPFELLEDLLTRTPARHKLFLMDACESGELEEDWLALADPPGNMRARTSKKITKRAMAAEERTAIRSIDRNRYIFYNLLRRSGAIVYSSSRGSEFSYEDPAIKNGWFTEKVLEALSGEGDRNKDGWVDSYELREFVTPRVAEETAGRQHPTVDRDNVHQTVRLPAGK